MFVSLLDCRLQRCSGGLEPSPKLNHVVLPESSSVSTTRLQHRSRLSGVRYQVSGQEARCQVSGVRWPGYDHSQQGSGEHVTNTNFLCIMINTKCRVSINTVFVTTLYEHQIERKKLLCKSLFFIIKVCSEVNILFCVFNNQCLKAWLLYNL